MTWQHISKPLTKVLESMNKAAENQSCLTVAERMSPTQCWERLLEVLSHHSRPIKRMDLFRSAIARHESDGGQYGHKTYHPLERVLKALERAGLVEKTCVKGGYYRAVQRQPIAAIGSPSFVDFYG